MSHLFDFQQPNIPELPNLEKELERAEKKNYLINMITHQMMSNVKIGKFKETHHVSFPITLEDWTLLFPFLVTRKGVLKQAFASVTDCEQLFGNEWFIFHFGQSLGFFFGSISFTLKEHSIMEHKTKHFDSSLVIPDSIKINSSTYLHISFHFNSIRRWAFDCREGENDDWKLMVNRSLEVNNNKRTRRS